MRLSQRVKNIILHAVERSFGIADVYLFGSRINDEKRGGDIDIAIDIDVSKEEFRKRKIEFRKQLIIADFDVKIDVVNLNTNDSFLQQEILSGCIKLA